ncbi:hypothetical protein [Cryptosporangium sp. NPDC048952]|uniref:hypothetical protein n=1 Tax=Cryptosporangium sp. NPDC048952 TaxID=3363961 RepID=UPI00371B33AB
MRKKSWLLIALSVLSVTIMAGTIGWAQLTGFRAVAKAPTSAGFAICATGDYAAYVLLTETNAKSPVAQPGKCVTQSVEDADATYKIQVIGLDGSTPFTIGDDEIGGDGSEKVTATGTMESPDWSWSGS